jgi:cytochrome c peroxidase
MKLSLVMAAACLATSSWVCAEEVEVLQIKQKFEPGQIEVKAGEPVNFLNGDDVKHNLRTVMPDGSKVDHGITKPGENVSFGFDAPGSYQVTCGIHPKMKLEVTVK